MPTYVAPASFEALVDEYDYYIEALIQKFCRGRARIEDLPDLKQSVYLRLWKNQALARYVPSRASFQNYLYQIVHSVTINTFQANVRQPLNCAVGLERRAFTGQWGDGVTLERRLHAADAVRKLEAVAATVRQSTTLLQVMALLGQERTVRDIATTLHCSTRRVTQQRHRLRKLLTHRLKVRSV